ncbi:hypothetical protein AAVH_41875 [Aphelenchoides avenae]|nr:hypothetical protein AAVH_41875 [Aphelenchus avenae]
MNDATRAGFASRSLKSTEAVFDFFANHISELNAPFTVCVTIVTETPELPTSGIDHYAWGTLGDGCVMLERSEVFERGGLGASIRKK